MKSDSTEALLRAMAEQGVSAEDIIRCVDRFRDRLDIDMVRVEITDFDTINVCAKINGDENEFADQFSASCSIMRPRGVSFFPYHSGKPLTDAGKVKITKVRLENRKKELADQMEVVRIKGKSQEEAIEILCASLVELGGKEIVEEYEKLNKEAK